MKQIIVNCLAVVGLISLLVCAAVFALCAVTKPDNEDSAE